MSDFSEKTRVQVPAAVHLCRLGYKYLSHIGENEYDSKTNILIDVFKKAVARINPDAESSEIDAALNELISKSANDDLGRDFYKRITVNSGLKIIDFENPDNNDWHCTTEFTCENKETTDNFRPDITCFVNGLPLVFIEVKIPNNHDGILAERERINKRMANDAFRTFFNVTQFMIFSNNQDYDKESIVPISGAFYATTSKKKAFFNVFREADKDILQKSGFVNSIPEEVEKQILTHRNSIPIKVLPEYETNKQPTTPTNRLITSMLSKKRLLFILNYGIAYVDKQWEDEKKEVHFELQKHIMRYQQLFATFAIRQKLSEGVRGGIIWHTQGSGKTALAYYSVKSLKDFYSKQDIPVKFYFVVDRLDLMQQAKGEFLARGLVVQTAQDRETLMKNIKDKTVVYNTDGKPEITVVNIQKFKEDSKKVDVSSGYNTRIQRVFFIDEAHRGYNPKGSFLANLLDADRDAIKIALTGTPLLSDERASWKVFGNYIDTYYYDKSIADGYTLKLMREVIETRYKEKISDILEKISGDVEVKKSDIDRTKIIESESYLNALLDYIVMDLRRSRIQHGCKEMAGMVVCETNPQARLMHDLFEKRMEIDDKPLNGYLILHDEGDKKTREDSIDEFKKKESIDLLFVNKMLLTGFDAPRLKKLYLCRKLDGHDLLQALTRVNRTYKDFKFGYIVDFANIKENFEETNNMYLRELNRTSEDAPEDEPPAGEALMLSSDEIDQKLNEIKDVLWIYDLENKEEFRKQVDEIDIDSKEVLYSLRKAIEDAKALANQVRAFGTDESKKKLGNLQPGELSILSGIVARRIEHYNLLEGNGHRDEVSKIINEAIAELQFSVEKMGEEELKIVINDLRERYEHLVGEFQSNFDQTEEKFVKLSDEFKTFFRKRGIVPQSVAEAKESVQYMDSVMKKIREINARNRKLRASYKDDEKFARIHKRIVEANATAERKPPVGKPIISENERIICENLNAVKKMIDDMIYLDVQKLNNKPVFDQDVLRSVGERLMEMNIKASLDDRKFIRNQISNEYLNTYIGVAH